jgi:hypothetical protein
LSSRFNPASRARLTRHDLGRFSGGTLFDRIGRAVCQAGCLPRKELYEAWEMARRIRRQFRGGRVFDLGAGHGLLAQVLLLLDDSSPSATVVDKALPASTAKVHDALVTVWPRLAGRVELLSQSIEDVDFFDGARTAAGAPTATGARRLQPSDLIVSSHACGRLSDVVIDRALAARARVAVLPCCHDLETCDTGDLDGWIDGALAIDVMRAARMRQQGYRVWTLSIPEEITPKNRLLLGTPRECP